MPDSLRSLGPTVEASCPGDEVRVHQPHSLILHHVGNDNTGTATDANSLHSTISSWFRDIPLMDSHSGPRCIRPPASQLRSKRTLERSVASRDHCHRLEYQPSRAYPPSQQMQIDAVLDTYTLIMPCSAAARRLFPPYAVIGFCGPNRLSPTDTTCVIPILLNMSALPACSLKRVVSHRHASTRGLTCCPSRGMAGSSMGSHRIGHHQTIALPLWWPHFPRHPAPPRPPRRVATPSPSPLPMLLPPPPRVGFSPHLPIWAWHRKSSTNAICPSR